MRMVTYGALLLYFVIFICHFLKDGPQNITYIQQVVMQNQLSAPTGDTKWVEGLKYLATVLWDTMHNNVDGDIIKNAAGNSEKVMQHCFRAYDPQCQTLKYVTWFKFSLLTWFAVYLRMTQESNWSWSQRIGRQYQKQNFIMTEKNNTKRHAMKDPSWVRLTEPVGQHINNNVSDLTLKGPPNIPLNSFPRNEKDCVFQSFTS